MIRPILLAVLIAIATAVPRAEAGSISLGWTPHTADQSAGVEAALLAYSIARTVKNRAELRQNGTGLRAAIRQSGRGNRVLIDQRGTGHTGSIAQSGNGNYFALFQRGDDAEADIHQWGGQLGLMLQYGW
ncbi:hypothetical protein [Oceaniovalibus sp. ACAM 378]|uniref:hypothetical protein n=1 Tax=Oceaniovalibus sp. ACAM 378 TaxID=2599923 RepID=UPI0011D79722|nr:hypothetical protein [Oceaniovalibus sp. ACAM 378]TYB87067.1 hypothetical protein FQ320_14650 [Oceaniovalibus sp. ACAM 378]